MSLTKQLAELKEQSLLKTPDNVKTLMQDATEKLRDSN